jgi:hypothetical protein
MRFAVPEVSPRRQPSGVELLTCQRESVSTAVSGEGPARFDRYSSLPSALSTEVRQNPADPTGTLSHGRAILHASADHYLTG